MKRKVFTTIFIVFFFGFQVQAQVFDNSLNKEKPEFDSRVLNHYSVEELNDLRTNYPLDYVIFTYYLTRSYSLEITSCDGCTLIDPSTFDISKYEYLRKKSETVVYDDPKHGFILTVYAIESLEYLTPQQEFMLTIND